MDVIAIGYLMKLLLKQVEKYIICVRNVENKKQTNVFVASHSLHLDYQLIKHQNTVSLVN